MSEKLIVECPDCSVKFVAPREKFLPNGRKVRCAKCGYSWFHSIDKPDEELDGDHVHEPPRHAASVDEDVRETDDVSEQETASPNTGTERGDVEVVAKAMSRIEETARQTRDAQRDVQRTGTSTTFGAAGPVPRPDGLAHVDPMPQVSPLEPVERSSWLPRTLFYLLAALIIGGVLTYFYKEPLSEKYPSLEPTLSEYGETIDGVVGAVVPSDRALVIENVEYEFEDIEGGRALLLSAEVANNGEETIDAPKLVMKILGADNDVLHEVAIPTEDLTTEIGPSERAPYYLRVPHPPEALDRVEVDFAKAE